MKKAITEQDIASFRKDSYILTACMLLMVLTPIPLGRFLGWWGMAIYLVIVAFGLFVAFRVERQKKKFDIQTYKEIVAFWDGKSLDEIEALKESGKRPYQKVLGAVVCALIALGVCALMAWLIG